MSSIDLVQRLRTEVALAMADRTFAPSFTTVAMREAADEIERLRKELGEAHSTLITAGRFTGEQDRQLAELRKEVDETRFEGAFAAADTIDKQNLDLNQLRGQLARTQERLAEAVLLNGQQDALITQLRKDHEFALSMARDGQALEVALAGTERENQRLREALAKAQKRGDDLLNQQHPVMPAPREQVEIPQVGVEQTGPSGWGDLE